MICIQNPMPRVLERAESNPRILSKLEQKNLPVTQSLIRQIQPTSGPIMETRSFEIEYPVDFEQSVNLTKEEIEHQIRLMAALKMFELGKISAGVAARLANLSKRDFYDACAMYRVSIFNYEPEEGEPEIKRDIETLRASRQNDRRF